MIFLSIFFTEDPPNKAEPINQKKKKTHLNRGETNKSFFPSKLILHRHTPHFHFSSSSVSPHPIVVETQNLNQITRVPPHFLIIIFHKPKRSF